MARKTLTQSINWASLLHASLLFPVLFQFPAPSAEGVYATLGIWSIKVPVPLVSRGSLPEQMESESQHGSQLPCQNINVGKQVTETDTINDKSQGSVVTYLRCDGFQ